MAYDLNGTSQFFSFTKALSTNACTLFVRFVADSKTAYAPLIESRSDGAQGILLSGGAGNPLTYMWEATVDEYNESTGLTVNTGTDYAAILTVSPTAAVVYLGDGSTVNSFTNTKTHNSKTPSLWKVGEDLATSAWIDGRVSEVAIWGGVTLTADEANILGKFYSPRLVRPASLSFYAPLIRELQDIVGGVAITNNNTATVAAHPRTFYPQRFQSSGVEVEAVASGVVVNTFDSPVFG